MMSTLRLLILACFLKTFCDGCPDSCSCKWKSGKQTVECINKDLLIIPEGMDSTTQVLDFTGNNLHTLYQDKFFKMDLLNLQRIYMSRCRIVTIEDQSFRGLTNLVELDLSENEIEVVPSGALRDCPALMRLILSRNPIKVLSKMGFSSLSGLNTLELGNCEIVVVEEAAFQGLYSLEWLHLSGNKMTALAGLKLLPGGLKGVQLQDNPWECDCHILELHAWLQAFTFPHSIEPKCKGPARLAARTIKSVQVNELACQPEILPTTFFLEIEEGKNVSLSCQVHAMPEAKVSWFFQGQLVQNDTKVAPGVHLLYYIEEGGLDKHSELYIYNANTQDNGTFVCTAENPAGISQANFTIRVIVKQEIELEINEIAFEFILIVVSTALVSTLLLVLLVILLVLKCQRSRQLRRKRNVGKAALRNATKESLLQDSTDDSENNKENSTIKLVNPDEGVMLYTTHPNEEVHPLTLSPPQTKFIEPNPDLINGTQNCNLCIFPTNDIHLNPMELIEKRATPCYRTLPNRGAKRPTAANPMGRFTREAEFLSLTNHPQAYEHYACDVRYTVDGYPVRDELNLATSPPESHKSISSGSTEPCCSTMGKTRVIQWPVGLKPDTAVIKKCVGAQTQTDHLSPTKSILVNRISKVSNQAKATQAVQQDTGVLENIDEGYGGDI